MRVAVITASDRCSRGVAVDDSGPALAARCVQAGWEVVHQELLPDDRSAIAASLTRCADDLNVDIAFTTGGTGLGPRDITPEATLDIADRTAPGIAEYMRSESLKKTSFAALSRAVAALRGTCLIINLPGSPRAVAECFDTLLPLLPHAVATLHGASH